MDLDTPTSASPPDGTESPIPMPSNEPPRDYSAASIARMIQTGSVFMLDHALNNGDLDHLSCHARLAVALFLFDFKTAANLLPQVRDPEIVQAMRQIMLFEREPEQEPDAAAHVGAGDPAAAPSNISDESDETRDLILLLLHTLGDSLADILSGQTPTHWQSTLHRYIYMRLYLYMFPHIGATFDNLFSEKELSQGDMYCLVLYHIEKGSDKYCNSVASALHQTFRRCSHIYYLFYRINLASNRVHAAKAWLLNAWVTEGVDERLDERLFGLFGMRTDTPAEHGDVGLRGLQDVGHPQAFAVRRSNLRLGHRPDSPRGTDCLSFADEDLNADVRTMIEEIKAAPSPWLEDIPASLKPSPAGARKRFLVFAPPKNTIDIALAASARTLEPIVGYDCLAEILRNAGKLEPDGGPPDLAMLHRHLDFLRGAWNQLEDSRMKLPMTRTVIHILNRPTVGGAVRMLWPNAVTALCVPSVSVAEDLFEAGVPRHQFDQVLAWRRPDHLVRILALMGIRRPKRRAVLEDGTHLRHLLYPT
jgi:hypothetical protein